MKCEKCGKKTSNAICDECSKVVTGKNKNKTNNKSVSKKATKEVYSYNDFKSDVLLVCAIFVIYVILVISIMYLAGR